MQIAVIILVSTVLLGLLISLIPPLAMDGGFLSVVDNAVSLFIRFVDGASYFLPIPVFIICVTVVLVVDNWSLMVRAVMYVIELVRG